MKAKRSFGFYLTIGSTALGIVSFLMYRNALMKTNITNTFLILSIAAGVCALITAFITGKEIPNLFAAAHVILTMAAIGVSISPMVNEIGLVYAGLNPQSNLTGYINFAAISCAGWLIGLVGSFIGLVKQN